MYALTPLQSWILILGLIVLVMLAVTTIFNVPFDPIDPDELEDEGDDTLDEPSPVDDSDIDWQAIPAYHGPNPDEIYDWAQQGL